MGIKYIEVNFGCLDMLGVDLDMVYVWKILGGKVMLFGGVICMVKYVV